MKTKQAIFFNLRNIFLFLLIICPYTFIYAQSWDNEIKIVPNDRDAADFFGNALALDGDYAIIGSYGDCEPNSGNIMVYAGSAYIFKKDLSGNWVQSQKITSSDISDGDYFGKSVSISGNYAIVGAWNESEDTNGVDFMNNAGSAYIFKMDSIGNWKQDQKLVASDRQPYDLFGESVLIRGDYAFVGASLGGIDTINGTVIGKYGCVYVFERDSIGKWQEEQILTSSDKNFGDRFGYSIDVDSSFIIIGAQFEQEDDSGVNSLFEAGSAYIFEKNINGTWIEQQKIVAFDRDSSDYFGSSVSLDGDYAFVGAPLKNNLTSTGGLIESAGAVYVFERDSLGSWNYLQKIKAVNGVYSAHFGFSVSISRNHAVIGAVHDRYNSFGTDSMWSSGSAYIFNRDEASGNWSQSDKITAKDRAPGDLFGGAVFIEDTNMLIGAYREDEDASYQNYLNNAGSVYFYSSQNVGIIEAKRNSSVSAYPNPTNDRVFIELGNIKKEILVRVTNIYGQVIISEGFNNTDNISIKINESPGLYLVQLNFSEDSSVVLKIIKE